MERLAQCHCGALKAYVSGDTERINICHCQACQRRTGALFHAGAFWPKEQVRVEGERKLYGRPADSGRTVNFYFCPTCGTNLYIENEMLPDHIGISIGSFADPTFPPPTYSVWEEYRHPWVAVPADAHRFLQSRAGSRVNVPPLSPV
jgi:hypothetical protein